MGRWRTWWCSVMRGKEDKTQNLESEDMFQWMETPELKE